MLFILSKGHVALPLQGKNLDHTSKQNILTQPIADKRKGLHLYDLTVFDHFTKQFLVFRLVLFLFQFCCMLGNVGRREKSS